MPLPRLFLQLADRQGIEKLICNDQRLPVGNIFQPLMPGGFDPGAFEGFSLHGLQRRRHFHQVDVHAFAQAGHHRAGANQVGQQCAPARPQFNEIPFCRCVHHLPSGSAPYADQLAEHLRYFRCGNEISGASERIAAHVVAVTFMPQRQRHIPVDRHRPVNRNHLRDDLAKRALALTCIRFLTCSCCAPGVRTT